MLSQTGLYILIAVVLLIIGIVFLFLVIRKARKSASPVEPAKVTADGQDAAAAQPAQLSIHASTVGLRLSFARAIRRIRAHGRGSRYRIPWYLMIGEVQSGKTTALGSIGLDVLSEEGDEQAVGGKQAVNWYFFDQGIVLDVAGDFVLRADGATSNNKGWKYLTKLLRRYRSERPLDGIILTIPAGDLVSESNQTPDAKFKLEQKAQSIYKKLVDMQKQLGLSLPVYVLVTKCDSVTGFKSLCNEIPDRHDEMFGWSSPYARGFAYSPEWVTEAFQNLHRYLFQIQIEVFAERDHIGNSDEFFVMPFEIESMRSPLQAYLDQIFKDSAFHDTFFFRGIYFCGDRGGETFSATSAVKVTEQEIDWLIPQPGASLIPAPVAAPVTRGRNPIFLTHLFERKIFQEESLAKPLTRTLLSRNRWVRAAQVLSLAIPIIGGLGILVTYSSLKARERSFYNSLVREELDLSAVKGERNGVVNEDQSKSRVANHFLAMSNMGDKSLVSAFIPGSWFSHVGENSQKSVVSGYPYIVLESLRRRLDCRTESKLVSNSTSVNCSVAPVSRGSQSEDSKCIDENEPPLNSMPAFIANFNQLTENRESYARLSQNQGSDLADLNRLLLYFNHVQVPASFDVHNPLFVQALNTIEPSGLRSSDESVYDRAACKVEGMVQDIYDRTFKEQSVTYDFYLPEISKTESLLTRPKSAWLANRSFEYSSAFRGLTFAAGLSELKRALTDLSEEKFMSRGDESTEEKAHSTGPAYSHAQARRAIIWDKAVLQQAVGLYAEYDNFIKSKTYNRRDTLDSSVKRRALEAFRRKFGELIARAQLRQVPQRIDGESARESVIRAEIKSLEESQDLLTNLLDIGRELGIDVGLRRMVTSQVASLMNDIDREFYDGNFYAMTNAGFRWWTLDRPFHSYTAFGATNPDELEVYLAAQREGIAKLARESAAPVITFMSAQNISVRSGSVNWKAIIDQLDKYDAKKNGNTISVLENFIRSDMDKITYISCDLILINSDLQPLDYFIRVRNSLRQPFYQRCQQLALDEAARLQQTEEDKFYSGLKSYTDIQDAFNQSLQGRFPFSEFPMAEPFPEADPASINLFFDVFGKNKDAARAILKQAPKYRISPKAALDFLDQMDIVQRFFASFLGKDPAYPTFDFALGFRVNKGNENGANQIIDWVFDVGNKRFHYQDVGPAGIWGYADPMTLTMRWADDSPTIPIAKFDPLSHMKLQGQTVTLVYNNNWSLLYLILKHKCEGKDCEGGVDLDPYTLKVEIPTTSNAKLSNSVQQAQPETVRTDPVTAFMRLALLAPGKKDPLFLPDIFPARAPVLTNKITSLQRSRSNRS